MDDITILHSSPFVFHTQTQSHSFKNHVKVTTATKQESTICVNNNETTTSAAATASSANTNEDNLKLIMYALIILLSKN